MNSFLAKTTQHNWVFELPLGHGKRALVYHIQITRYTTLALVCLSQQFREYLPLVSLSPLFSVLLSSSCFCNIHSVFEALHLNTGTRRYHRRQSIITIQQLKKKQTESLHFERKEIVHFFPTISFWRESMKIICTACLFLQ